MADLVTVYNPADAPFVLEDGTQVNARSWRGAVLVAASDDDDAGDQLARTALADGRLVVPEQPEDLTADGLNPDAVAAFQATADAATSRPTARRRPAGDASVTE